MTGPESGRPEDPFAGASPALGAALVVRFLVELALLAGVAVLAWQALPGWSRWPGAILAVVAVATVWGLFLSPKASIPLSTPVGVALEAVLFVGTGAGLAAVGLVVPATVGGLAWLVDRAALSLLRPRPSGSR